MSEGMSESVKTLCLISYQEGFFSFDDKKHGGVPRRHTI